MPLSTGLIIVNRYRVVRLLGQGGFGAVYRIWDSSLNRPCALKESLGITKDGERQFKREATILANLSHPNLPRVTDYFTIPGQGQYLVMDFVEGADLQEKLDNANKPLSEDQVLHWMSQVCDALTYLHSQDPPIIHRDIKPANIRITPEGKAMLVDFGIAKYFSPGAETTTGAKAITPGFSPVEQYGRGGTDIRTDVYALGATMYILLTNQSPPDSLQRALTDTIVAPTQLNLKVTKSTEDIVMRALQMDPRQRFQSISQMKDAIEVNITSHARLISPTMVSPAPKVSVAPRYQTVAGQPGNINVRPARAIPRTAPVYQIPKQDSQSFPWLAIAVIAIVLCIGGVIVLIGAGIILNPSDSNGTKTTATYTATVKATPKPESTATRQPLPTRELYPTPPDLSPATWFLHPIQGQVQKMEFFESGSETVPKESRIYATEFNKNTARYINWELYVTHPAPGTEVSLQLRQVYLDQDGNTLFDETSDFVVDPNWKETYFYWGYGYEQPGDWLLGTYTVEIYESDNLIANAQFQIIE